MIVAVVVALDESADVGLNIGRQIVVLKQDVVLQGLMPALDFALGLGMVGGATDVIDTLVLEPVREIACDVGRAAV